MDSMIVTYNLFVYLRGVIYFNSTNHALMVGYVQADILQSDLANYVAIFSTVTRNIPNLQVRQMWRGKNNGE